MPARKKKVATQPDLTAVVEQSIADKLISSTNYPFTAFEQNYPFNGKLAPGSKNENDYLYTDAETENILKNAVNNGGQKSINARTEDLETYVSTEVLRGGSEIIESAKNYLDAKAATHNCTGPDVKDVKKILDDGVGELSNNVRGIQFKAHCAWLKVVVSSAPNILLNVPVIGLNNVNVSISATGELWWYHPTLHCSSYCTNWSTTWGWDRLASLTVRDIKFAIDAHAELSTNGSLINVKGVIDKLRLNYPILKDIPLEGIANSSLGNSLITVFDAGKYIACVPIIDSKFKVDSVGLPAGNGRIVVEIIANKIS